MITYIRQWLSEKAMGVSLYSVGSGIFAQILLDVHSQGWIMKSIVNITTILGFLIALLTVTIKLKDVYDTFFGKKKKKDDDAD